MSANAFDMNAQSFMMNQLNAMHDGAAGGHMAIFGIHLPKLEASLGDLRSASVVAWLHKEQVLFRLSGNPLIMKLLQAMGLAKDLLKELFTFKALKDLAYSVGGAGISGGADVSAPTGSGLPMPEVGGGRSLE